MTPEKLSSKRNHSSQALLRAIADAQEIYDRRYKELVGPDAGWRDENDLAASWLTVLHGAPPPKRSAAR